MRWGLVLVLVLAAVTVQAQSQRAVYFAWTWDVTTAQSYQVRVDTGAPLACPTPTRVNLEWQCGPVTVPTGTHTFELRGVSAADELGLWSDGLTTTVPVGLSPGAFTITMVTPQ